MFFSTTSKKIYSKISALLCIVILAGSFAFAPISFQGEIQVVEAQLVTYDPSNAALNTTTSIAEKALLLKELKLDGILNGLAKLALKSMTQSILNWINSGFQGSPAFVTDLKQFLLDEADQIVGDFIYNDPSLNLLCSPFQLDVKIALATTYQEQTYEGFSSESQCTLSGVVDNVEGFLNGDTFSPEGLFEITQNPINTPTGAYLAAQGELSARIVDERGNTINELEWGKGFLSFKVCSDTQIADGTQQNCDIVTPGSVIADQINKSLGAGQDQLIAADEVNEVIGALFAQLAQKAITGIYGILGLGGGSGYSDNTFGPGENKSYLDALQEEDTQAPGLDNPIESILNQEMEYVEMLDVIISETNNIESLIQTAEAQYGSCFNVSIPSDLSATREDAILKTIVSSSAIDTLHQLNTVYLDTSDSEIKLAVVEELRRMQSDGLVTGVGDNATLQFYIQIDFPEIIKKLKKEIRSNSNACEE